MAALLSAPHPKTVEDVHILPISREVDRAVLPFLPRQGRPPVLHAHRILVLAPDSPTARRVASKVERALQPVAMVERHLLAADADRPTAGFQGILRQLTWLCRRELSAGHRVHINLSSGSKLVAFAAGIAGMAHLRPGLGSLYYVQPAGVSLSEADFEEHGVTRGVVDVEEMELMPLLLPAPPQLAALDYLHHAPGTQAGYRDLLQHLSKMPGSGHRAPRRGAAAKVRDWNNAATTRMVRTILAPLQEKGLVEIEERGRSKVVHLTRRGALYAAMAGLERPRQRGGMR